MDFITGCISHWLSTLSSLSFGMKLSISVGTAFAVYYKLKISKVPQLLCKEGPFRKFLKDYVPVSEEKFSPFFLMFGTTFQTIAGAVLRSEPKVQWDEVEDIDLPDKGQVHLHWLHEQNNSSFIESNRPIVLLLPGLTGNNQSNYICHFAKRLEEQGYRAVVFTYRGMGGKKLKTAKTYCACSTDDLEYVIKYIKEKYPDAPLMAAGVSLGAMILFHYLVRTGDQSGLIAGMIVSVPWNPFESMKTLSTPLNTALFNRRLAKKLIAMAEEHSNLFEGMVNLDHVRESNTIHEFDESFTARVFGFDSLDHYYSSARASDKVDKIKIPVLALNAEDDPFSPGYCVPLHDIAQSEHLAVMLTERGGHVGFIDTFFARGVSYMDRVFIQYVDAVFKNQDIIASI